MKTLIGILNLTLGMATMAGSISCVVGPNKLGVEEIVFTNAKPHRLLKDQYFDRMLVKSGRGTLAEYFSDSKNTITGMGLGEQFAVYASRDEEALASIRYSFFVLPNEPRPNTGRAAQNGVEMKIILPPANEELSAQCVVDRS